MLPGQKEAGPEQLLFICQTLYNVSSVNITQDDDVQLPMRRRKQLEDRLRSAETYEQWAQAAQAWDDLVGLSQWRKMDQTRLYDHVSIRYRLDRLRALRSRQDDIGLLFTLNEGIHGNMAGMGKAAVHSRSKFGTKHLIESYVDEIAEALQHIATTNNPKISFEDKLDFFNRASQCYGRSALMLSGGGALGFYHIGVVKALLEQGLLPNVISGSSAGSIVAAVLGTHNDDEMEQFMDAKHLAFEAKQEASWFNRMFRGTRANIDIHDLQNLIARLIPDMTFEEAYRKTGRNICISIAPAEPHQTSRLLNAIASPNVYIRTAVLASCAVPGVYPPVSLQAKNVYGDSQPYLASRKWIDGSISDDLPAKRLSRMYGVNHFLVSQINPVVLPFISRKKKRGGLSTVFTGIGRAALTEVLDAQRFISQNYLQDMPRVNMVLNSMHSLAKQEYSGDINIVPSFRFYDLRKLLAKLSEEELVGLMREGERAAWPQIETIRTCTKISKVLDGILEDLQDLEVEAVRKLQGV